jgi:ribosome-associated protein
MGKAKMKLSGEDKGKLISQVIQDKQATGLSLLDVSKTSTFCDFFIICSGESSRQTRAIYEAIIKFAKQNKSVFKVHHTEDDPLGQWLLIDLLDIVVHIFLDEVKDFYNLENLFKDATKISLS